MLARARTHRTAPGELDGFMTLGRTLQVDKTNHKTQCIFSHKVRKVERMFLCGFFLSLSLSLFPPPAPSPLPAPAPSPSFPSSFSTWLTFLLFHLYRHEALGCVSISGMFPTFVDTWSDDVALTGATAGAWMLHRGYADWTQPVHPKTQEQRQSLSSALQKCPLFQGIDAEATGMQKWTVFNTSRC